MAAATLESYSLLTAPLRISAVSSSSLASTRSSVSSTGSNSSTASSSSLVSSSPSPSSQSASFVNLSVHQQRIASVEADTRRLEQQRNDVRALLESTEQCGYWPSTPDLQQQSDEARRKLQQYLVERQRAGQVLTVTKKATPTAELVSRHLQHKLNLLQSQSEICSRLKALQARVRSQPTAVADLLSLDLVIVMDCTSSMYAWRDLFLNSLPVALDSVDRRAPVGGVRIAFVGYRDCSDIPRLFTHPFIARSRLYELMAWIKALPLEGGGSDIPEDVVGGLYQASQLLLAPAQPRTAHTSAIIVVGDAPCHGQGLHSFVDADVHLPPLLKDPFTAAGLLSALSAATVELAFLRLNAASDAMYSAFRGTFDQSSTNHHMVVLDVASSKCTAEQRSAALVNQLTSYIVNCQHKTLMRDDTLKAQPNQ